MKIHQSTSEIVVKKIWRLLTPLKIRYFIARIRMAMSDTPIISGPTYADDGLITQHVSDFLTNPKFMDSYNLGKQGGALDMHPGDIHYRAYIACWAAKYATGLDGDFIECGVGKALLSKTIVNYLDFEQLEKKLYLFDTFEGIPVAQAKDDKERGNMARLNQTHFSISYYEDVMHSFLKYPNVILVKGRIPESFSSISLGRVSYISIDMNNAYAEMAAIEYLWEKLVIGGVIVLDDYAYGPEFMEQKYAWDKFAALKDFEILTLPTGQGLIIRNK